MMQQRSTSEKTGLIDVKGVVAVDQHVPTAGAIVWWRLRGSVDYEALSLAWDSIGETRSLLPAPCTETTSLRRAVGEIRAKRTLVRPLGKGNGFAIVREKVTKNEAELEHEVLAKVTLDGIGRLDFTRVCGHVPGSSVELDRMESDIRSSFKRHLSALESEDISSWLVWLMPRVDAVSLRQSGGVYFIPAQQTDRFAKIVSAIRSVSDHVVNRVPAMRSDDAVAAILDALEQEATAEAASMEAEVEAMKLGERGFSNRIDHCDAVETKVTRYEELLGKKLDSLRIRLQSLRASLTMAVMKTRSNTEKDSG